MNLSQSVDDVTRRDVMSTDGLLVQVRKGFLGKSNQGSFSTEYEHSGAQVTSPKVPTSTGHFTSTGHLLGHLPGQLS